jgi:hypothetical protein
VSESAERALIDTLEEELRNKELLLVLDNFEQCSMQPRWWGSYSRLALASRC